MYAIIRRRRCDPRGRQRSHPPTRPNVVLSPEARRQIRWPATRAWPGLASAASRSRSSPSSSGGRQKEGGRGTRGLRLDQARPVAERPVTIEAGPRRPRAGGRVRPRRIGIRRRARSRRRQGLRPRRLRSPAALSRDEEGAPMTAWLGARLPTPEPEPVRPTRSPVEGILLEGVRELVERRQPASTPNGLRQRRHLDSFVSGKRVGIVAGRVAASNLGRIQSDTWAGCIVSPTTARSSAVIVSRSISSRRRALEGLECLLRVVLAPVEAAVDDGLDAHACRSEEGGDRQRRAGDGEIRAAREWAEDLLERHNDREVESRQPDRDDAVNERPADNQVDLVEAVAEDRDGRRPREWRAGPGTRRPRNPGLD